jgi:hypothetical protein
MSLLLLTDTDSVSTDWIFFDDFMINLILNLMGSFENVKKYVHYDNKLFSADIVMLKMCHSGLTLTAFLSQAFGFIIMNFIFILVGAIFNYKLWH